MVPDLFTLVFSVAAAVVISTTLVLFFDSRYRTGVVDWWYGDREAWWEKKTTRIMNTMSESRCAVCGESCTLRCGKCKAVKYCSQTCQRQHWREGHKQHCKSAPLHEAQNDAKTKADTGDEPDLVLAPRQVLHPYNQFLEFFSDPDVFERETPVGLRNLGNTCFANSVLQCLLHTRGLASFFRSRTHGKNCVKPSKHYFCLLCAMESLTCEYWDSSPEESIAPKQLMQRLSKIAKHMVLGRQEDAHEFYVHLVDVMEAIMLVEAGGKEQYDQRTRETTFIHHLFGGFVRSRIVCGECGRESRTFESTMQLELAISAATDSVETALKRHFQDEVLDGDNKYQCEGCKKKVRAERGQRLEVAPNVLVICLKRFDSGSYFFKNNKPVRYKELLDVGPYLASDSIDSPSTCLYQLHGVVMHLDFMNSTGSGHYLSYVSPEGHHWYQCNDSTVHQINKDKALDPRAYMLFYTRRTPHAGPKASPARPSGKLSAGKLQAHELSTSPCSEPRDSPDLQGPQSHPIPGTNVTQPSPSPCETPSPTKAQGAAMSFDTALQESTGNETTSWQTRVAGLDTAEVSSRPLHGDMSSTSESTDEGAYSDYLPYCVKAGKLGQPGVVKLLLNLGSDACRAQDVQVAMSGTHHILVHVPARVPLDLDMGDGVVIDQLECALVRKRNRLKITCTLTAADTPAPEQAETLSSHPNTAPPPIPTPLASLTHPSQAAICAQAHPSSSRPPQDDTASETDDVCAFDQSGGLYDAIAALPTDMAATCPDDSEQDAVDKDCWSWPASVGSECESLDLFRHSGSRSQLENDQSTSSSNSVLGAHPLSSAPASENPYDSDHPSPLEDAPTSTQGAATSVSGKKRRIKQHSPNKKPNSHPPTPTTALEAISATIPSMPSANATQPREHTTPDSSRMPAPPTPTRTSLLAGTTIEVEVGSDSLMPALVQDTDALSLASDSDTSQEKSSDGSVVGGEAAGTGGSVMPAVVEEKVAVKKVKNKPGKGKGKKKKARKH